MNGAAFLDTVIDHRVETSVPTNTGQALFVMRSDLFQPAEDTLASFASHLEILRTSSTPSGDPVRLPGDSAAAMEQESDRLGITISEVLVADLNALAARLGVQGLTN